MRNDEQEHAKCVMSQEQFPGRISDDVNMGACTNSIINPVLRVSSLRYN